MLKLIAAAIVGLVTSTLLAAAPASADSGREIGPIVAVGDSIVQGAGTSDASRMSWPARVGARRAGSSGGCVIGRCWKRRPMVEQFDKAVLAKNPSVVIIAYGINDVATGAFTAEQIVDGIANLAWRARAAGAEVHVQTLIPVGARMWNLEPARRAVNDLIRARFTNVIDMEPTMLNPANGLLWQRYNSSDDLHPNANGYRAMAGVVRSAIGGRGVLALQ